jgi:Kdo2-lipid IVA lauroyltransferase/acyltransferase
MTTFPNMQKLQNYFEYLLCIGFSKLIMILPLSCALAVGRLLGKFIFSVLKIRRQVAIENLSACFPDRTAAEIKEIACNTFINFACNIIEFMRMPKASPDFLARKVNFINEHLMQEAFAKKSGTLCLSGHFGNWEIMAAAIQAKGYQMVVIARDQRNMLVNDLINQHRKATGIETIQLGIAIRGVLKALRENKFVAMLGDQDAHADGVFVDFLGRLSSTAPGIAQFALRTRAPIIFGAAVRGKNGCHTIYLQPIQYDDLTDSSSENIRILTQRHARALEECVRKWPDHWFWLHKRWKTAPSPVAKDELQS